MLKHTDKKQLNNKLVDDIDQIDLDKVQDNQSNKYILDKINESTINIFIIDVYGILTKKVYTSNSKQLSLCST